MSFDTMVTIKVGPDEKVFTAPRNVFCQSPFFKAALSGVWAESKEGLTMPEDSHDAFATWLQWAFSGQIVIMDDELTVDTIDLYFTKLVELYILADKIGDIALQNNVVDQVLGIITSFNRIPQDPVIQRVFAGTPEDCRLQKLILDQYTYETSDTVFSVDMIRTNAALFAKVLTAMTNQRHEGGLKPGFPQERKAKCYYHVHNEDTPACK